MRTASLLATLTLLGAACGETATEPVTPVSRRATDAAPSGIPVAATRLPWNAGLNPLAASVTTIGDSLVFSFASHGPCAQVYDAVAGLAHGILIVTDVGRTTAGVQACTGPASAGGVPVRLAVQAPVRGRLLVVLRARWESVPAGRGFTEIDVLQQTVTVP